MINFRNMRHPAVKWIALIVLSYFTYVGYLAFEIVERDGGIGCTERISFHAADRSTEGIRGTYVLNSNIGGAFQSFIVRSFKSRLFSVEAPMRISNTGDEPKLVSISMTLQHGEVQALPVEVDICRIGEGCKNDVSQRVNLELPADSYTQATFTFGPEIGVYEHIEQLVSIETDNPDVYSYSREMIRYRTTNNCLWWKEIKE